MHGSVFLGARDEVLRPALLWNDQRTAAQCAEITERVGAERLLEIAGNPALTGFQAPKIRWLRARRARGLRARARSCCRRTTCACASPASTRRTPRTPRARCCSTSARATGPPSILDALEIPAAWLPAVHEGPQLTGRLRDDLADELGLPRGLPVAAGGGDNAAAAIGVGVVREGAVSTSIGTSGVLSSPIATRSRPTRPAACTPSATRVPDAFHLMAVTLSSGGSLSWWRDQASARDLDTLVAEAEAVAPGAEGLVFLPVPLGRAHAAPRPARPRRLRRPHAPPRAAAHLTRAVMEGVAFSMRDGLEIMRGLGTPDDDLRAVGGGARSPAVDAAAGRRLRPRDPAHGDRRGAGLRRGAARRRRRRRVRRRAEEASTRVRLREEITEPDGERARRYDELYRIYAGLYPSLRDAMHELGT